LVAGTDELGDEGGADPAGSAGEPEAPVTKMRMKALLGCASDDDDGRRKYRGRKDDAIRLHQY
jgi:hypothetical protein